jgi:hypothetical protein
MCTEEGCLKAVAEIEEKILNDQVGPPEIASTGGASSSRDDQARNSQQAIQALKDDVAQLKETVRGMQERIVALSAPPAWKQRDWSAGYS